MNASSPLPSDPGSLRVDLGQVAHTVTKALDYVGVDDKSHGRRVGLMCHRIAHNLGWDRETRHFMLIAGMIHDCGVSSTAMHQKLVDELEWAGADDHCVRGAAFAKSFRPFSPYATVIRHHHCRWINLPEPLDTRTKEFTNLVFLADRFDVIRAGYMAGRASHEVLRARHHLADQIAPYAGTLFSPRLFAALQQAIKKDGFWIELEDEFLDQAIFETLSTWDHGMELSFDDISALGEMISHIVDAKSPFTHYHSLRVADLTHALTGLLGFENRRRQLLRMAALLHDVGKLRTPDEVLEKPSALDELEHDLMLRHPLDSKVVLAALFPHTPIARWAAHHHEKLDGSGYPYGWAGDEIDAETRVLTICDIFQALCQKRPYRGRLPVDEVMTIMSGMETAGEIDRDLFALIRANQDDFYQIAIREG